MGAYFWNDILRSFVFFNHLTLLNQVLFCVCVQVANFRKVAKSWTAQIKETIFKKQNKIILPKFVPNDDWGLNIPTQ